MEIIVPLLITLVILIVIFLILREINLWYWKINERIEISQRHNYLLELIANHLTGGTLSKEIEMKKGSIDHKEEIDDSITSPDVYSTLSEQEKIDVESYMNYGLSKGDKLVINKKTRKLDRFDVKEWNKIQRNATQDDWLIISEK